MTPQQEAVIEHKIEKHFRSHRELPNGRNFTCWNRERDVEADRKYLANYDQVFRKNKSS